MSTVSKRWFPSPNSIPLPGFFSMTVLDSTNVVKDYNPGHGLVKNSMFSNITIYL